MLKSMRQSATGQRNAFGDFSERLIYLPGKWQRITWTVVIKFADLSDDEGQIRRMNIGAEFTNHFLKTISVAKSCRVGAGIAFSLVPDNASQCSINFRCFRASYGI